MAINIKSYPIMKLIAWLLGSVGCAEQQPEKPKPKTYTKAEVLELLVPGEFDWQRTRLINAGTSLYPVGEVPIKFGRQFQSLEYGPKEGQIVEGFSSDESGQGVHPVN